MARGNKGVPSYFSNLLGVVPKGLLPLRAPRQAIMRPAAETAAANAWTAPVNTTAPPVPPVKNRLPSPVTLPIAEIVPPPNETDASLASHDSLMIAPSAAPLKHSAIPDFVDTVSTSLQHPYVQAPLPHQATILFDSPMRGLADESDEVQSSPPRLGSFLERATARFIEEQELRESKPMPMPVPQPQPNSRSAPANRPNSSYSNPPAIQSPQARPAEPLIEIGHLEVTIHPAPGRTPAPARTDVRGPLTRSHYLHGFRQS